MTLDEAIKYCLEVAEHNEYLHKRGYAGGCNSHDCLERAIIHRQIAEWLTELKELRNSLGAVKLSNMKEALALIRTLEDGDIECQ